MVSRTIGAAFRLYLVAMVFEFTVFSKLGWNVPFWLIVLVTIGLIWLYTSKGGMKTIIWTDTLQTAFMLIAVVVTLVAIGNQMELDFSGMYHAVMDSGYAQMFEFEDVKSAHYFWKDFLSGALISIVMTGLDQDMMQKNLTCKTLPDAQKNMAWFSSSLVVVNLMFLALGALLYIYAGSQNIALPEKADQLYPMLATDGYLGTTVALFFVLGLIAAAYSSADSALTALTTSFSVDILRVDQKSEQEQVAIRKRVHIGISLVLAAVIIVFSFFSNSSVIADLFKAASYTYGPILGLFAFGISTTRQVQDKWVWPIAIASPVASYLINLYAPSWLAYWGIQNFQFGYAILLLNGLITYTGLWAVSRKATA
jgi:Na+/proline symporter